MSKKQDRQGARTPADLERKYDFGQNFGEVKAQLNAAQRAAADAQSAVAELNDRLTIKIDAVESQSVYTAMMTDTLLEGQEMKEKISNWYTKSLWTADMVNSAVEKGVITEAEATEILNQGGGLI